jgi:hypothetical protein
MKEEKEMVLKLLDEFITPLKESDEILTSDMIKALIAKCKHLILTDL